ncbi:MAG TPA: Rrf2 family transcriptional regulator [bacterium]
MKLSTRSIYGMRALAEIALGAGRGVVSASHVAERQGLSLAYLEQLFHRLKKAGVVTSARGPHGGYRLARDPREITMADVVSVLDGARPSENGRAAARSRRNGRAQSANGDSRGRSRDIEAAVHRCVYDRLAESLSSVTLQDLCDEVRSSAGEPLDHRYVFHI